MGFDEVGADLFERIPPEAAAAVRFVDSNKNPFFDEELDLLFPCVVFTTGGAVSLFRFFPNFFFVVVSDVVVVVGAAVAD